MNYDGNYLDITADAFSEMHILIEGAIAMMMRLEGIVLDTCYTGKAFAGLVRRAREGFYKPEDNVLFVHTGGAGGLFAQDWETENFQG